MTKKALLVVFIVLSWASPIYAQRVDTIILVEGRGQVHLGVPIDNTGLETISIQVAREDNGDQVFCAPVNPVDGFLEVKGSTIVIDRADVGVTLRGFSWTEVNCTGISSLPSPDHYIIQFVAPGQAELVIIPSNP